MNDSLNVRDEDYYGDGGQDRKSKHNTLNNRNQYSLPEGSDDEDLQPTQQINLKDYDGFQQDFLGDNRN